MNRIEGVSWEYRLEYGSYYYYDGDGEMMFMTDEIAIGYSFDPDNELPIQGTMHKHGPPESVKRWLDESRAQYKAAGLHDMAERLGMVNATELGWSLEQINSSINNSGHISEMIRNLDAIEVTAMEVG